ncbi:MAG: branched-chain amino acid ABC transporter permease [Afipia sp.]|jgi:branched-chain amino acid transport system permease protein|nr:branched-chain amino acid ABC transporter permease [Afipia sp.]
MSQLALNAVVSGILLGGFYACMALGISIAFGMLDVTNIAHPAFAVLAAFIAFKLNTMGVDVLLGCLLMLPLFYIAGRGTFRFYHAAFERHGEDAMRGLAFFFGLMFVIEIGLALTFGVDLRALRTDYTQGVFRFHDVIFPRRTLVCFAVSAVVFILLQLLLTKSFVGRAILAGAQNPHALRFMGINPTRIREIAFGISVAAAAVAGVLLLLVQPVEPFSGREYIGRVFAVCVLGGLGSIPGTFLAAIILGVCESVVSTFFGPSWSPAAAFGILLATLAFKPSGLFGK